jgi:hypothetical protein
MAAIIPAVPSTGFALIYFNIKFTLATLTPLNFLDKIHQNSG